MFWTQAAGNGGQHWFIYLGEDATNYYVYDANYKFTQQIRYNAAIPKSSVDWFSDVYHATDYDDINGGHAHNYKYKYFLEAHPHRDYYECSCGDGYVDNSSSRYYISKGCSECGATITPNTYYFVNKGTGKALNLEYNIDANQTNVHMYDLSIGYPSQQMVVSVRSSSDKSYKIRPTSSKRLVQPFGDSGVTTSGMNVNIYDDVNDNTQWWHFQPVSGGYVIRNAANTSCVLTASGENAIVSTYTGSNNQIWTLQPVAQKYTISYNANGGSGTMANTEMTVGTAANLRANAFTRTGYTFLGWSTSSSATSATYIDKQSVKDLAKSGTVTLYAVWAIKDLTGVSNVKMTATETTVKLSWDKDSTATYYEIQKRVYGESGCEKVIRLNSDITSYTVTGLKPGTSYVFEIGSYNDASGVIYTCNTITTNPSAITGFKGTAKSTVVTLSWDKNAGATEYKLQQQTNGAWLTIASPTETSYTVTGLKANTTYNFRIFARNGNAQSTQTKLTVTTTDAIAPVSGFTGNAAADSIMLEWHHIGVATSFKLQQSINGAWQTIAETNKTSFNVTGLKANTTYNFRIFARYYDLQSAQTKLTVTTPAAVPTAVTGFKGTAAADSITLKWNKVANATSYKLQQQINGAWQTIASPTGTTYIISGLKANTSYNFRIFARNSAGQGAQTKLTITTLAAVPPAVTGFTGAAAADSITLKWNKAANATSYKLQQQINGAWQTIASPTGTTYIVSGLKANTSYNFRIFTRNSAGQGAQTKLTVTTSAGTPTTVTGFTGAAAADSITLKWNKAANATSYKLQQQINGAWQTIASPTGTTYIVSGLKAKTSYNFRIFPRNSAGQGAQTKLSVKTLAGTPAAVTGFSGTATEKSITLKWNKVSGATEYKLQQSINGAWQTIASPTGTSYTVKGLKSNTSYNFRIFARNSSGQGTQTKLTVKTTAGKPAAVTGFTGTATKNSITLKWNKVSGATEYKLQQMTDSGWETIAMPTGNTLTVSGLNAKTMYNFRIFARSGSLQSDQVKLTVRTTN